MERAERISAAFHGRDRAHDADGPAHAHRERAGDVGGQDLAGRCVRAAGGLPEQPGHEVHLEHAEAEARAGLAGQQPDDLVHAALEDVGGPQEDALPHGRRRLRPLGERRGCGVDRRARVRGGAGGHARHDVAGERIDVVERATVRRPPPTRPR